jgi:hypothetical protein
MHSFQVSDLGMIASFRRALANASGSFQQIVPPFHYVCKCMQKAKGEFVSALN